MADPTPAGAGRAKPNKILQDFFAEVSKGFIEDTFKLRGKTWTIRTPTPDEEAWADKYVQPDSALSYVATQRISRLAVGIKAIDGTPLDGLYSYPDDMTVEIRKQLDADPDRKRYWLYGQLMASLASDVPPPVIKNLWEKYDALIGRQSKALEEAVATGPNS
jgi:hypothetical protein